MYWHRKEFRRARGSRSLREKLKIAIKQRITLPCKECVNVGFEIFICLRLAMRLELPNAANFSKLVLSTKHSGFM